MKEVMRSDSKCINFIGGKIMRAVMCSMFFACLFIVLFSQPSYAATTSAFITIDIEQSFRKIGSTATVDDEFSYEFTALNEGNPMPIGSIGNFYRFRMSGNTTTQVGPIEFLQPGIYLYEIKNVPPSTTRPQYTHDLEVYMLRISVAQRGGSLVATMSINDSEYVKSDKIVFNHQYEPLPSVPREMVDPPVKKTVVGSPNGDSIFVFTLTATTKSHPMPEGSQDGKKEVRIAGPGEVEFGTWPYLEEGLYHYTIAEVNRNEAGYQYDRMLYTITDVVRDEGGVLKVYRTVENASNKQVESLTFVNEYHGTPTRQPSGPKTGDDSSIAFYIALILLSAMLTIICIRFLRVSRKRYSD